VYIACYVVYIIWHLMETEGVQTSFLYLIKFSEKFLDTPSADRVYKFVRVHS
jgi:hypothetical protein